MSTHVEQKRPGRLGGTHLSLTVGFLTTGICLVALTFFPVTNPLLSIARIGLGLLYLGLLPGYVLLRLFDAKFTPLQSAIYGVGVSLVYDVAVALAVNFLLRAVGVSRPLDPIPIVTVLVASVFVLYFVALRRGSSALLRPSIVPLSGRELRAAMLFVPLPIASVIITYVTNSSGPTPLMIVLLCLFSLVPVVQSAEIVPERVRPLSIYCISVAVLYHTTLVSPHLWGWDIHAEYHSARLIQQAGFFDLSVTTETIPLLIITLLSGLFSNITQLPLVTVFKGIYPLLFSILPLSIYYLSLRQFESDLVAVIAPFVPMFFYGFFKVIPDKQAFGELYLLLFLTAALDTKLRVRHRHILSTTFIVGLVLSHYAVSLIAIALLVGTQFVFAFGSITNLLPNRRKSNLVRFRTLAFLVVCWLVWFSIAADGITVQRVETTLYTSISHIVGGYSSNRTGAGYATRSYRSAYWIVYVLLSAAAVGFVGTGILKTLIEFLQKNSPTTHQDYAILSVGVFGLLCSSVFVTFSLGFDRILNIALVIIAPFAVYGLLSITETLDDWLSRLHSPLRIRPAAPQIFAVFLALLFVFSSGAAFAIGNEDVPRYGIALSDDVDWPTYPENEVAATRWLDSNREPSRSVGVLNRRKYIDSRDGLLVGEIQYRHDIEPIFPQFAVVKNDTYLYVSSRPLWKERGDGFESLRQTTFYRATNDNMSKIYSSRTSEIYVVDAGDYSNESTQ
ncbi:DUF2206 domain-containing protein [Haladaptatus cibarius]|uniref:DUF2206 domain-containing protein n=1 Tax=Haladaptatus cibarius TaxID=453847 RepID=UPI00130D9D6A|nr:DUF2206 domain-containing protein [Haladaptatus cibarius]